MALLPWAARARTSTGGGTNYSLSIHVDGTFWAWGQNTSRQFGLGTAAARNVPVQVQVCHNGWSLFVNFP